MTNGVLCKGLQYSLSVVCNSCTPAVGVEFISEHTLCSDNDVYDGGPSCVCISLYLVEASAAFFTVMHADWYLDELI